MTKRAHDFPAINQKCAGHASHIRDGPPRAVSIYQRSTQPFPEDTRPDQLTYVAAPQATRFVNARGRIADRGDITKTVAVQQRLGDGWRLEVRDDQTRPRCLDRRALSAQIRQRFA